MGEKLFGTSGIRRHASFFSDEVVKKLAYSLAEQVKSQKIAVGRDTRLSSPEISKRFISYLSEAGKEKEIGY